MIATEKVTIHGKEYNRIYSTVGAVVRCGRKRYVEVIDPVDVERAYFEEGVEPENEPESEQDA